MNEVYRLLAYRYSTVLELRYTVLVQVRYKYGTILCRDLRKEDLDGPSSLLVRMCVLRVAF